MMLASASGVLKTLTPPNSLCRPCVALKTPPLPFTLPRYCSRDTSATSSPKTTMRGSRRISSRIAVLMRSTIVVGAPENRGSPSVSNCALVGSTVGEYSAHSAVSGAGCGCARASSVATSRSASTASCIALISASVAWPSATSQRGNVVSGSRAASASRSAPGRYSTSSSDSECEYGRMTCACTSAGPFRSRA